MTRVRQFLILSGILLALLTEAVSSGSQASRSVLVGTWTGTVSSRNFASFVVNIKIIPDQKAHLVAEGAPCLAEADLVVTISESNSVTLAGTSRAGESITFKGTVDSSGKQLDLTYIANGSASARCETDQGSGTLDKE